MTLPSDMQVNAWAGLEVANTSDLAADLGRRLLAGNRPERSDLLAPSVPNKAHWWDPAIGWGIVLPDDPALPPELKAGLNPTDPPALHRLLEKRGHAPVYRYAQGQEHNTLYRYFPDGGAQKVSFQSLNYGTGAGQLPLYLLIYAPPSVIPWDVQYALQFSRFVGRLDLEGAALDNYVAAITADWLQAHPDPAAMTIWSVAHDPQDITELMLNAVAMRLFDSYRQDGDYTPQLLARDEADQGALCASLAATQPAFIATTSHGATMPLSDVPAMQAQLGLPVDQTHQVLDVDALLQAWSPQGAIWYAHACCSAGTDAQTHFAGYVSAGSDVGKILNGVAACGAMTAPLPRALLGAADPLRAFVGHVEPTFNWTLMHPRTREYLTTPIVQTFYQGLYSGLPIGMALDPCRRASAAVTSAFKRAEDALLEGADMSGDLLRLQLTGNDWDSLVLLGDPAVTLHPQ